MKLGTTMQPRSRWLLRRTSCPARELSSQVGGRKMDDAEELSTLSTLRQQIDELKRALEREKQSREEERRGRTRAEGLLRQNAERLLARQGYTFPPIGILHSPFRQRRGTPRQGLLAPSVRSVLKLEPTVNWDAAMDGMQNFSHVWLVYIFHLNTNVANFAATRQAQRGGEGDSCVPVSEPFAGLRTKITPPRCDGAFKVGVMACRSPHRPNPIGLSIAKLVRVDVGRKELILEGADVVHGSPVIDVKPYVSLFDSLPHASHPSWVQESYAAPMRQVEMTPRALREWDTLTDDSSDLSPHPFDSWEDVRSSLAEVLSMDIRSPHQRSVDASTVHPSRRPQISAASGQPEATDYDEVYGYLGEVVYLHFRVVYGIRKGAGAGVGDTNVTEVVTIERWRGEEQRGEDDWS
ncbi:unnamed protein product [Vitrella brassicaformis CCMP3155]|uniref:TsaA-like domain-containing protein n=2 Tax=Vitrella brassicaformis TaxID=1169539 RepID=A0A0G4GAK1_VITBC|nr:unnamed protein product [Vitrella brassicaformis CCMP3155]|eukprot:CEM25998.1 unnamed protein product [Vitrella brassicaformis CCMP3155]